MVIVSAVHRIIDRFGPARRVQELSQIPGVLASAGGRAARVQATLSRVLALITGPLLLLGGLLLAHAAHQASRTDALWTWENRHAPPPLVWQRTLQSYGYIPVSRTEKGRKATRLITSQLDEPDTVWTDSTGDWVGLGPMPSEGRSEREIYCRACGSPPGGWEPHGRGWTAFLKVLEKLENTLLIADSPRKKHPPSPRDPREIRY